MLKETEKQHLTEFEAAAFLGLQVATLRNWRSRGHGPEWAKFGQAVRYPIAALKLYAEMSLATRAV